MKDVDATERSHGWLVWPVIGALALVVRIVYLYQVEGLIFFHHLVGDARSYDVWAQRIAAGDWWGSEPFYQAPLYPYFLAGVYTLLGHDPWLVRVVQCVLGAAGCSMVGLAGSSFISRRVGVVAGIMLAVYPPGIYFDGILQKTSLGSFLMASLLIALSLRGKRWWQWLTVGALVGLLSLTRENALVLAPLIIVWVLVSGDGPRTVLMIVAGLSIVLLPVGFRNHSVGGEFALTTFQSGPNFYMGNHEGADGRYAPMIPGRETPEFERIDATALAEAAVGKSLSPAEVSQYWHYRAWSYITSNPVDWLKLLGIKWWLTWNRYEIPDTESYYIYRDTSSMLRVWGRLFHFGVLCPLAVVGVVATWPMRRRIWLLHGILLALAASVAAFYVFGRYRYPLVPVVSLFAAAGVVSIAELVGVRAWARLGRMLTVGVLAAAWINWPINPETELNAGQLGNLGAALAQDGQLEDALPYFAQAVELLPGAPRLQFFLAVALARTGHYGEAIPHYDALLRLQPSWPSAEFNLGVAFEATGQREAALTHYRLAIEADPSDREAWAAIARLETPR